MTDIPKKYIVDEQNRKVAVQLDIETFEKIVELLENHGLVELKKQNEGEEKQSVAEAKVYHRTLNKQQ